MSSRKRMSLLIVTAFWGYFAMADVLSANSTQAVLTAMHAAKFFAPWGPQALQHLILYPVLLGCVWASGRIGWRPFVRRFPLQVVLATGFSGLAVPSLMLADLLAGDFATAPHIAVSSFAQAAALETWVWLSGGLKFLLAYAFAIALVAGFELYRSLRDEASHSAALEQALVTARLASLRMQLSPHSLFNLLHTLHGQIEWDPGAARALVVRLGDLLRRLLNASEREYWRLSDEVQFARLYLELQQGRFAERLQISAPGLKGLPEAWVPSLILQPLVENAVVHGLCGHRGPVAIRVEVVLSETELRLRVINTTADGAARRNGGIGLKNVSDRLAIHFGEHAAVCSAPGRMREWLAEICLPLLFDVPAPAGR